MRKEIVCTACGKVALVRREPLYEDFRKIGETVLCTACGHRYAYGEAIPWREERKRPALFTEADRPAAVHIFRDEERGRCCRYCRHFVVNPFTQRCDLHNRTVAATDLCFDFDPKAPEAPDGTPQGPSTVSPTPEDSQP